MVEKARDRQELEASRESPQPFAVGIVASPGEHLHHHDLRDAEGLLSVDPLPQVQVQAAAASP